MWIGILQKILPYALAVSIGVTAGMVLNQKMNPAPDIPECPACKCPEPTVAVQPFDFEGKIKGVKTINYSPQFSGSISVAGVDSTALSRMIDQSIEKGLAKYNVKKGRR